MGLLQAVSVLPCLWQVYDPNGDGVIDQSELREIIKSCVAENGMEFDETQVILVLRVDIKNLMISLTG